MSGVYVVTVPVCIIFTVRGVAPGDPVSPLPLQSGQLSPILGRVDGTIYLASFALGATQKVK